MPCTYTESAEEIAARKKEQNEKLIQPYKKKLDEVTRLLCHVMTELSGSDVGIELCKGNDDLAKWWEKHQKDDKDKKADELRKSALSKLTPEEKKSLGL